jgi:sec-independent protein translocase protein TatA
MFNLGGWEWVILLVIVLIVFGVGKLSGLGGALGKTIHDFREQSGMPPSEGEKKS